MLVVEARRTPPVGACASKVRSAAWQLRATYIYIYIRV